MRGWRGCAKRLLGRAPRGPARRRIARSNACATWFARRSGLTRDPGVIARIRQEVIDLTVELKA